MPEHVTGGSVSLPGEPGDPGARFIALFSADRAALLKIYAKRLERPHGPVAARPHILDLAIATGDQIIADVLASLRDLGGKTDDHRTSLISEVGYSPDGNQLSTTDLLRITRELSDVTVTFIARYVSEEPALLPYFINTVLALNDNISRRIKEATIAHVSYLLDRIDQAHIDERHRIARDLHDRLGEGMSAALRQLELYEISTGETPGTLSRLGLVKDTLSETMRRLRTVTSDLRQDSVRSLEKALVQYIDEADTDADVRLRVSGDETWAPASVIDEAYLIIREAIRNALRHAAPRTVLIGVACAPHEMHAWVEDDGHGLEPAVAIQPPYSGTGTGLASMRERAALIGGRLTIASIPGRGTSIELLVPLSGHRDDDRK